MNGVVIVIIALALYIEGCNSPEAGRTRGGGPGADVGNRGQAINMHEGSHPFYQTPELIPAKHPSLESARQADQLSRK